MIFKIVKIVGWTFFGVIIVFFLNYYIIEPIVIPDPCAYHGEETGGIFNLFYKMDEGFHPFPTLFNSMLTVSIGTALGFMAYQYFKNIFVK